MNIEQISNDLALTLLNPERAQMVKAWAKADLADADWAVTAFVEGEPANPVVVAVTDGRFRILDADEDGLMRRRDFGLLRGLTVTTLFNRRLHPELWTLAHGRFSSDITIRDIYVPDAEERHAILTRLAPFMDDR